MPQPAYVQAAIEQRVTVTSGAVSGLDMPMPTGMTVGNFLLAVISTRPSGVVPTTGFSDDLVSVTGSGTWTQLLYTEAAQGVGGSLVLYGKHVTGGEGNLKALITPVGVGGNGTCWGNVLEFSNVARTNYFTSPHVTGQSVSGMLFDADANASGPQILLVQIISAINGGGFSGITGATSGDWNTHLMATTVNPRVGVWSCTGESCGGAAATSAPAGGNPFTAIGFGLAPCSVDGSGGGYSYVLGDIDRTPEGGGRRRSHGMPWWIKWRRAA